MATKKSISIPDWVEKEIVGQTENRSGRIVELIIKGYMAEKDAINAKYISSIGMEKKNALSHSLLGDLAVTLSMEGD